MDFQDVMNANIHTNFANRKMAAPLVLTDGTVLSIQASENHYCCPKATTSDYKLHTAFEICTNKDIAEFNDYKEEDPLADHDDYCIYFFVPASVIKSVIEARGGIKSVLTD